MDKLRQVRKLFIRTNMGSSESVDRKLNALSLSDTENAGQRDPQDGTGSSKASPMPDEEKPVEVHSLTESPNEFHKQLSQTASWKQNYKVLSSLARDAPKPADHVRFVCISDTHNKHNMLNLPDGDVLLHAGDFTWQGTQEEVESFCNFLKENKEKYKHIVVIAGNHELSFDDMKGVCLGLLRKKADCSKGSHLKAMLRKHCTYLEDEEVKLMGFRIYGSPWQPYHRGWAFNLPRGEVLLEKWNKIPNRTDILITHGPPLGHGDTTIMKKHVGCVELLNTIQQRVKPKLNLFGHIHEGHGITTDGITTFVNAAACNFRYQPIQPPILIDLPIPCSS